ncbi:MAG: MFS transporter [Actinobacteria bacterium]|nr:MFS transporter [Actinomycetota bacterium]
MREPLLRTLLLYGVLASVVSIVPEGLAVAVAAEGGDGAVGAGVLTAAVPLGYVIASLLMVGVPNDRRLPLLRPLTVLLCLPLILTPLVPSTAATALLWAVAGLGTAVQLVAAVTYVARTPAEFRGRAFGVASTLLMLGQGVALLVAGAVADTVGARNVIALTAAAGLALVPLVRTPQIKAS